MHWKTGLGLAVVIVVGAWVAASRAQVPAANGARVAVCNLTMVFGSLQMAGDLESFFGGKKKQIEQEALVRRDKITVKQQELEAFAPGSPDHVQRRDALIQMQVESEVWIRRQEVRLRDKHKQWFEKVYRLVQQVVTKLARDSGVDVVVTDNPIEFGVPDVEALVTQIREKHVIYASPTIDLTAEVIERANQAYHLAGGPSQIEVD